MGRFKKERKGKSDRQKKNQEKWKKSLKVP